MALRFNDNAREKLAMDLYAHFEPHGTTDAAWDEICGWIPGSTRELLEKIRFPTDRELIEICHRLQTPLGRYVVTYMPDSPPTPDPPRPRRCTPQDPCCGRRLEEWDSSMPGRPINCPRNCLCHA